MTQIEWAEALMQRFNEFSKQYEIRQNAAANTIKVLQEENETLWTRLKELENAVWATPYDYTYHIGKIGSDVRQIEFQQRAQGHALEKILQSKNPITDQYNAHLTEISTALNPKPTRKKR